MGDAIAASILAKRHYSKCKKFSEVHEYGIFVILIIIYWFRIGGLSIASLSTTSFIGDILNGSILLVRNQQNGWTTVTKMKFRVVLVHLPPT